MLTTAIPDNGLKLYRTSYAVRSAITATAELRVLVTIRGCIRGCIYKLNLKS